MEETATRGCTTPDWSHPSTRQWCNPATPPRFPGETGTSALTRQARPGDGITYKKTVVAVSLGLCPKQGHHGREGHSSRERRGRSKTSKGTRREPPGLAAEGLLALPPNPNTETGGWQRVLQPQEVWGGRRDCEPLLSRRSEPRDSRLVSACSFCL